MNILIVGGAGYIGSHILKELESTKHNVIVYDNLSTGHIKAIPKKYELIIGELSDEKKLAKIMKKKKIDIVIHLASLIEVRESLKNPGKFYRNNVADTINLLEAMKTSNVKYIIFSSTGLIGGVPKKIPVTEDILPDPQDPYTKTKAAIEDMIKAYSQVYSINYCIFRYFNAAGAHESGEIGENHKPESHLIPNVLRVALGESDVLEVFGNKHNTKDGYCVRDYIHVMDIAKAHLIALETQPKNKVYNLGSGKGYSVKQIIEMAREVTLHKIPYDISAPRDGEVPKIYADISKAKKELKWEPEHDLRSMIETAWNWHSKHPEGFKK
jgi:UDP-glucose 4-epimerase